MGLLKNLLEDEFKTKFGYGSEHSDRWKIFYGKSDLDRSLNLMIDTVQNIAGDASISQVLIHDKRCPTCKESLPKFKMIKTALEDRMPNYKGTQLEMDEKLRIAGELTDVTGKKIYKIFESETKGVPFVIQNGEVVQRDQKKVFTPLNKFIVAYIGKIDPFRFLATSFNIKNLRV